MLPRSELEGNDLLESDIFSAEFRAEAPIVRFYTGAVEDDL